MRRVLKALSLFALSGLLACGGSGTHAPPGTTTTVKGASALPSSDPVVPAKQIDRQLRDTIQLLGLTGDPSTGRNLPAINDPLAQLGKRLFFTQALGGQFDSACASCHLPVLGGGDGMSLGVGVDAVDPAVIGPGRLHKPGAPVYDGGPVSPRNSLTTFNSGMWDSGMFWDSWVESIGKTPGANGGDGLGIYTPDMPVFGLPDPNAGDNLTMAQARFPIVGPDEMQGYVFEAGADNQAVRDHLAARIGDYGVGAGEITEDWLPYFRTAFQDPHGNARRLITEQNIARAIGEYERSQVFVETPWKEYVEGNDLAISTPAKRGALLFFRDSTNGGANCYQCHSGDFFTDEQHHVLGLPHIGRGMVFGPALHTDPGRTRTTGEIMDGFAFRTPTLLNLLATAPYGHNGAYTTLDGIVRHHLDPLRAVVNYDPGQLDPLVQLEYSLDTTMATLQWMQYLVSQGLPSIEKVSLSEGQVWQLVAFLETLTDPCVLDPNCLEPWMQRDDGFDSHLLIPKDGNGTPF